MTLLEQYEKALNDYFDTLEKLDKLRGKRYGSVLRDKLKRKLKVLAAKCRVIEAKFNNQ